MTVSWDRDGDYHRNRVTVRRDRRWETWERRLWVVLGSGLCGMAVPLVGMLAYRAS